MCLLLFAVNEHPEYPLVVAANRDEFYARPTAPAQVWEDEPGILAGRDLQRGGTWLGVNRDGRWAAVTAFREMPRIEHETSRGHLVSDYLGKPHTLLSYAERVLEQGDRFAGFNLLLGDRNRAVYCSNRDAGLRDLNEGVHGLSNHLLDTPWPKLTRAREHFAEVVRGAERIESGPAFEILGCTAIADDGELPDTGVGLELERLLSPAFITGREYGTRSSTVFTMDSTGLVRLTERTYIPDKEGLRRPERYQEISHDLLIRQL